jgi:hypothetical protein
MPPTLFDLGIFQKGLAVFVQATQDLDPVYASCVGRMTGAQPLFPTFIG